MAGRDTRPHGVGVSDIVTHVQKTDVAGRDRHSEMVGYDHNGMGHSLGDRRRPTQEVGESHPQQDVKGDTRPGAWGWRGPSVHPGIQNQGETRALQEMDTQRGERDTPGVETGGCSPDWERKTSNGEGRWHRTHVSVHCVHTRRWGGERRAHTTRGEADMSRGTHRPPLHLLCLCPPPGLG